MGGRGAAGLAGAAPSGALFRPRWPESSPKSSPSRRLPPNSARLRPDGRARGAPDPGEGGARKEHRAAPGGLTSARPARRQQTREGRGRARSPAAARLSWAPGSPALRPPVPKLLNLRAAHALRGQRPTRRIGPWRLGSASLSPMPRAAVPSPLSAQLVLSVAPPLAAAPSPERGQSSARTREGIPPFAVPPPNRPPFPGSAGKNGLERQARELVAPSRTPLPAAGAQGWQPRARSGPWRRPSALAPPFTPRPAPRGFHTPDQGLQFQASWGQNRAEEPLETSVSPSGSWKVTRNRRNRACRLGHALLLSGSGLQEHLPTSEKTRGSGIPRTPGKTLPRETGVGE